MFGVNDGGKVLLGVTVNQSWKELAEQLETNETLSEIEVIVSDGEPELRAAFANENIQFQTDLIHGFRILGYKLWEDHRSQLKEKTVNISLLLDNYVALSKTLSDSLPEFTFGKKFQTRRL